MSKSNIDWLIGLYDAQKLSGELSKKYPFNQELTENLQTIELKINRCLKVLCERASKCKN